MKILVLNAGSSTQKSVLFDIETDEIPSRQPTPLWKAHIDGTTLTVTTSTDTTQFETQNPDLTGALPQMLETLWSGPTQVLNGPEEIDIVGHRVVHGGRDYRHPTLLTAEVKAAISALSSLAPAHNPAALAGVQAIEMQMGDVPQIAVFDTAFHSELPEAAAIYPGPYEWAEQGIRRYGFHGISHQDCAQRSAALLGRDLASLRLITCHLGNGCSLAAIRGGHSVDTTMGFTTLEGLMMGTRSGSIDPGILLYLQREKGLDAAELDRILNKGSGLKGISGLSGDMREIAAAIADGNPRARLAFDIYLHRLCSQIGSMLGNLGGLDALVFTAGVGEHSAPVRAAVCQAFAFLGIVLDEDKNSRSPIDQDIATAESAVRILVMEAQEDWAIAKECAGYYRLKFTA